MSNTYTFKWPKGPQEVIVTGSFDNWSKTLPLVKEIDGSFSITVPLPNETDKLLYKYVVDGDWKINTDERVTTDDAGIENNFLEGTDLVKASGAGAAIPEAGGLVTGAAAGGVAATVMPKEAVSQKTLGEPGIHIPQDPEQLKAFETVRDVDPKTLNEPELSAEEKKKQKKKVKRSQYKKKKKAAAAAAGGAAGAAGADAAATTTTTDSDATPEPEAQAAAQAALAKAEPKDLSNEAAAVPAAAAAAAVPVAAADAGVEPASKAVDAAEVPEPTVAAGLDGADEKADAADDSAQYLSEAAVPAAAVPAAAVPAAAAPAAAVPAAEEKSAEPVAPADASVANDSAAAVADGPDSANYSSLDPKATEVDAAPGKPNYESEDEIIVAHGNKDEVEKAIRSTQGDVEVEEIEPTASEKARLTKEAETQGKDEAPAKKAPVKKTATPAAKKDEKKKKKSGFLAKLKKIFS